MGLDGRGVRSGTFQKKVVHTPPQFSHTQFEATIWKLQSAASGEWMVMFKVPAEYRNAATSLGDSYGLSLHIDVTRKKYTSDDDNPTS